MFFFFFFFLTKLERENNFISDKSFHFIYDQIVSFVGTKVEFSFVDGKGHKNMRLDKAI